MGFRDPSVILLPYLRPTVLAFFLSMENDDVSLFTCETDTILTVHIASKARTGLTAAGNALALVLIGVTIAIALGHELPSRRAAASSARTS